MSFEWCIGPESNPGCQRCERESHRQAPVNQIDNDTTTTLIGKSGTKIWTLDRWKTPRGRCAMEPAAIFTRHNHCNRTLRWYFSHPPLPQYSTSIEVGTTTPYTAIKASKFCQPGWTQCEHPIGLSSTPTQALLLQYSTSIGVGSTIPYIRCSQHSNSIRRDKDSTPYFSIVETSQLGLFEKENTYHLDRDQIRSEIRACSTQLIGIFFRIGQAAILSVPKCRSKKHGRLGEPGAGIDPALSFDQHVAPPTNSELEITSSTVCPPGRPHLITYARKISGRLLYRFVTSSGEPITRNDLPLSFDLHVDKEYSLRGGKVDCCPIRQCLPRPLAFAA
ncbi:hypothetical protein KIN20_021327 [Parelaphostrongylus tenuis]|uniref:Uncharacterized protein n=1 Tax=Parelaphostrongylus tenuis TaxID=148309 RepID=A0AAD5N7T8_PARTN|nr:hypothetical protein KIN20_021327 [Parelaphostrongylus tenuis]